MDKKQSSITATGTTSATATDGADQPNHAIHDEIAACWAGDGQNLMDRLDQLATGATDSMIDEFVGFYTPDELIEDLRAHRVDSQGLRRHCDLLDALGRRLTGTGDIRYYRPQLAQPTRIYDTVLELGDRMAMYAPYNPNEYGHMLVDICAPFYLRTGNRHSLLHVLYQYVLGVVHLCRDGHGEAIDMARVSSAMRMLMLAVPERRADGAMAYHPEFPGDELGIIRTVSFMDAGQSQDARTCRILADAMGQWIDERQGRKERSLPACDVLSDMILSALPDQRHIMACLEHDMAAGTDGAVDGAWLLETGLHPKETGRGLRYGHHMIDDNDPDYIEEATDEGLLDPRGSRPVQRLADECTRMGAIHMYLLLGTGSGSPYATFERIMEGLEDIDLTPMLRTAVEGGSDGDAVIHEPWIWWLLIHYLGAAMEILRLLHLPMAGGRRHRDGDDPAILRWRRRLAGIVSAWTELIERSGMSRHHLAGILLSNLAEAGDCAETWYDASLD